MTWITPKVDWSSSFDSDGNYTGDYFGIQDYARIMGNLNYLRSAALALYPDFDYIDMGEEKERNEYPYAEEFNRIERNLTLISENTIGISYGTEQNFVENGNTIDYLELNRIEEALLDLYGKLYNQHNGRRMLTFMFGQKEVF